jgi:hypothetical protein
MDIIEMQKEIDNMDYWDCKVLDININYFGDEVTVVFENDKDTDFLIKFLMCYKVSYETDANNRWNHGCVCSMEKRQLGYYAHDITIEKSDIEEFIEVKLVLPMFFANIICKEISVSKIEHIEDNFFWAKNKI